MCPLRYFSICYQTLLFVQVKSAYSARLKKDVAIKCINTEIAPRDFVEKFLPRELQVLPIIRHDNIVRVYEILEVSFFSTTRTKTVSLGRLMYQS